MPKIKVDIVGDERGLTTSASKAGSSLDGITSKASKLKGMLLSGLGAAGVIELGKSVFEAANAEETANAKLTVALKNSHSAWTAQAPAIENAVKVGEKYGYSAAQTKSAVATLTTALGSPQKALKDLSLAQDLAAKTGKPLEAASIAIAKAQEGQLKPLKQLGIDLPVAAGGSTKLLSANNALQKSQGKLFLATSAWQTALAKEKALIASGTSTQAQRAAADKKVIAAYTAMKKAQLGVGVAQKNVNTVAGAGTKIIGLLAAKIKGSANAQAETFAGKVRALKAKLEDFEAVVGAKVIPIVTKLAGAIVNVIQWFQKGSAPARALEAAIAGLAAGFAAFKVATLAIDGYQKAMAAGKKVVKLFTAEQEGLDAAMDANPIALVVAAIAALAVGVYLAYKHFKPFREAVDAVWHALDHAFNWVKEHWKGLAEILLAPFAPLLLLFDGKLRDKLLGGIKSAFDAVVGFLKGVGSALLGALGDLGGTLVSAGASLIHGLWSGASKGVTTLLGWLGTLGSAVVSALGDVGKWLVDVGKAVIGGLWRGIQLEWHGVLALFRFAQDILAVFATVGTWLLDVGKRLITGLWDGLKDVWKGVLIWFNFERSILGVLASAGSWLLGVGGSIIHGLYSGASAAFGRLLGWVAGLGHWIVHAFGSFGSLLLGVGAGIVEGLVNGIRSAWHTVTDFISSAASHLPGPVKKILGINSPSRVFHELGFGVMEGFSNGLRVGWKRVTGDVATMSASLGAPAIAGAGGLGALGHAASSRYAAGGGYSDNRRTVVNLPAGVDPEAVVRAQRRYDRRNGTAA